MEAGGQKIFVYLHLSRKINYVLNVSLVVPDDLTVLLPDKSRGCQQQLNYPHEMTVLLTFFFQRNILDS